MFSDILVCFLHVFCMFSDILPCFLAAGAIASEVQAHVSQLAGGRVNVDAIRSGFKEHAGEHFQAHLREIHVQQKNMCTHVHMMLLWWSSLA